MGESTNILHGKVAERGTVAVEGGRRKEGKFPVMSAGWRRLSVVRAREGFTRCHGREYEQNYHLRRRSESMRT